MAGKPLIAQKGYLTPPRVASIARKKGFFVNAKTLSEYARAGKIPFVEPVPGKKNRIMFPETKIKEVLAAAPKKAIMPKNSASTFELMQIAKQKKLKINLGSIQTKIHNIETGKESPTYGLARDLFDPWHRHILPAEFIKRMLKEAKHRKNLPMLLERKKIIPLSKLAKSIGLKERSLHVRKGIKKIRVGTKAIVTSAEAKRFTAEYLKQKENQQKKDKKQKKEDSEKNKNCPH